MVNGKLIALAESHDFQVLLTADANIKNQQNLSSRSISILIMRAYDNRLATHVQMVEIAKLALRKIETGEIVEVFHPLMKRYQ